LGIDGKNLYWGNVRSGGEILRYASQQVQKKQNGKKGAVGKDTRGALPFGTSTKRGLKWRYKRKPQLWGVAKKQARKKGIGLLRGTKKKPPGQAATESYQKDKSITKTTRVNLLSEKEEKKAVTRVTGVKGGGKSIQN